MADDADLAEAERIEQRQHIGGMLIGTERPNGLVAVAEAAQVWREQGEAIGKPRHHRLPGEPEFRPAMQQQQWRPGAGARDMERGAIGLDGQVLHGGRSLSLWPAYGILSARALSGPPSSPRTRPDRGAGSRPFWRLERWQSG